MEDGKRAKEVVTGGTRRLNTRPKALAGRVGNLGGEWVGAARGAEDVEAGGAARGTGDGEAVGAARGAEGGEAVGAARGAGDDEMTGAARGAVSGEDTKGAPCATGDDIG